jgi:hypothetical protein
MSDVLDETAPGGRHYGNWRHRESREREKYVGKRVSPDEHALIKEYAQDNGTSVADLLAPTVDDILERARAHRMAKAS